MPMTMDNPQVSVTQESSMLGKTLLWMCYGLILTFGAVFGFPAILEATMGASFDNALYVACGIGGMGILILSIIMMFKSMSIKGFGIILFSLYSLFMGLALSPLYLLAGTTDGLLAITYTLLVTAGVFGIMGLIGVLSKGRIRGFALAASGLAMGTLIIVLVNMFVFNTMMAWIASFAILFIFMLYTVIDFARISSIPGRFDNGNLAIMCAFTLYTDFIVMFIRILPFILQMVANNDN